jgi:hypothetical protein
VNPVVSGVDLSDEAMPPSSWKNTITVYHSGWVIIRLSWSGDVIAWGSDTSKKALNACSALCLLMENCC